MEIKSILQKMMVLCSLLSWGASFAMLIVAPEFLTIIKYLVITSILLSLNAIFLYRKILLLMIKTRFFLSFCAHFINVVLVFSIFGVINYLIYKNNYVKDFTIGQVHTLSKQSVDIVKKLNESELTFELFAPTRAWEPYINLLELYKQHNSKINLKFFDIEKELGRVKVHNIQEPGTLVVTYKKKSYKSIAVNELAVTNLLLKVLSPNRKVIYYTIGHNELSLDDKNDQGANYLKEKIISAGFEIYPLDLQKGVPSDASSVLILNPVVEFLDSEIEHLKKYVAKGGSLTITSSPSFNELVTVKFHDFLKSLGVYYQNAIVLDRLATQLGSQPSVPVINNYGKHKITKGFEGRTLFPISAFWKTDSSNIKWSSIVKSSPYPASWGEFSFEEVKSGKAAFSENQDFKGPLKLMIVGENVKTKSRFFLSSSTSFISNQFKGQVNNFNLFLNGLSWNAKEENLMSLSRPKLDGNLVYISDIHLSLIFYFVILLFPFTFFGLSFYFYRKRLSK